MHEILASLESGSRVLDLGCATGSFPLACTAASVIRVDTEAAMGAASSAREHFVQASAGQLPFKDQSFAAIVSNHSLEHFVDLKQCLEEIGRVASARGALFVAVPDASTLTDRIYRWLGKGGGHVNPFTTEAEVVRLVEKYTGLKHVATRTLCSSLSFLNRHTAPRPLPRRLLLVGGGYESSLFLYAWLSRRVDLIFHTRLSVYGWALYFGNAAGKNIDCHTWLNVCIRCGSGFPSRFLASRGSVRSALHKLLRVYDCPGCGTVNPFINDP